MSGQHRSAENSNAVTFVFCTLLLLVVGQASAQQWPLHFPEPSPDVVRVLKDIRFATTDTISLLMDVYRPNVASAGSPALIFYTLYWPAEGASLRESDWYKSWARIAAANGIVAIVPDLRAEPGTGNATTPVRASGDDFQRLVAHLTKHASEYGVDPARIAVYAASGAAWAALPAVEDTMQSAIKAAVIYYGSADIQSFRRDLPLLWIRAGLDSERTNSAIARASSLALSQNAPVTLLNHPTGRHAFEGRDNNAATRAIIEQTLAFVKYATMPDFQAAIRQRS
ncbi:MAG: hypothetical protein DKINENOH_01456 [bacterium]|nr:hypothetical protein [bacterium]MCK6561376.1 hypothetical protein [bacterium]NUM65969.1 hypothetical protein [candidate division KSB1 bacterium]